MKSYLKDPQGIPLLPVLSILANFVYEQPTQIIEGFVMNSDFQAIMERGLNDFLFESQRETVLICNNLLFKSNTCRNFVTSSPELVKRVLLLNNEEVEVFRTVI